MSPIVLVLHHYQWHHLDIDNARALILVMGYLYLYVKMYYQVVYSAICNWIWHHNN